MNRVVIVGSGGSGKSTFSVKIASILNLPLYHLDKYFWKPGWEMIDMDEWLDITEKLVEQDRWIIEGNYKSTMGLRMERADTIIFLDRPRYLCLINAFKRYLKYHGKDLPFLTTGCKEKIDFQYYKWIWNYPKRSKQITQMYIDIYGKERDVNILKSKKEIEKFLDKLFIVAKA